MRCLNAHCEIHKQFSVFGFFQSCKSDLPLPESGSHKTGKILYIHSQNEGVWILGGVTIYFYIYIYSQTHLRYAFVGYSNAFLSSFRSACGGLRGEGGWARDMRELQHARVTACESYSLLPGLEARGATQPEQFEPTTILV